MYNLFKEPIKAYPAVRNAKGQKVPIYEKEHIEYGYLTYENNWDIDGNNQEQYTIYAYLHCSADSPIDESWRIFYDDNMYTCWRVYFVRHPYSLRIIKKIVYFG
ncbi:hypothetical protein MHB40_20495 [Lysinibacillus sp. FSL K6-0057]|uniref:hypothetical protein n=1 Tax=unclassified Lysinibacillus TaxID=2636778 RepID=UPI00315AF04F